MKYLLTITISTIFYFQLSAKISVALSDNITCVCLGNPQQAFAVTAEGSAGPFTFEWEGSNSILPFDSNFENTDDLVNQILIIEGIL